MPTRVADELASPSAGQERGERDESGDHAVRDRVLAEIMANRESFLAFVVRRVRSSADAEDIFHHALAKASAFASSVRDHTLVRAWFFQILRRTVADYGARHAREARCVALVGVGEEEATEERATCRCTLAQLSEIRGDYADILRRVDIEEQSLADAAAALGVSVNNATVRLHRARRALRERLQAVCGTDSVRRCLDCRCSG